MNCTQIRRFLYAFADGELGVKDNCDVLDHLKMCPACARIASDQQTLRRALGRSIQDEPVPAALIARIRQAVLADAPVRPVPLHAFRRSRIWAAAAVFLMAAGLGAYSWWERSAPDTSGIPRRPIAVLQVADETVATHCVCAGHPRAQHQSRDLANTLEGLRDTVTDRFGSRMEVLVPDLSEVGFTYDSANFCGVEDKKSGLHILYKRDRDDLKLSFFSVPRCAFNCRKFCNRGKREYYVDIRERDGVQYAVAGWQCRKGRSSFLVCARLPEQDLLNVVETVRMTDAGDRLLPGDPPTYARSSGFSPTIPVVGLGEPFDSSPPRFAVSTQP